MQTLTTKLYYKDGTATKGVTCTSNRKGENYLVLECLVMTNKKKVKAVLAQNDPQLK